MLLTGNLLAGKLLAGNRDGLDPLGQTGREKRLTERLSAVQGVPRC